MPAPDSPKRNNVVLAYNQADAMAGAAASMDVDMGTSSPEHQDLPAGGVPGSFVERRATRRHRRRRRKSATTKKVDEGAGVGKFVLTAAMAKHYRVGAPATDDQLTAEVFRQPVVVSINIADDFYLYQSGVFSSTTCKTGEGDTNHLLTIVGYGDDVGSFSHPPANGNNKFWILKNSWDDTWGLKGYMKMVKDTSSLPSGMCGINNWAFAITM